MLESLVTAIETLKSRIRDHRQTFQENESRTRMALIDPLLQALGWDTTDPSLVLPEYPVAGKRADYALLNRQGKPILTLEAKHLGSSLMENREQMLNYANMSGVSYAGLTDGDRWEIYKVFDPKPIDERRVLKVSIANDPTHECALKLLLLWRPNIASGQPVEANPPVIDEEDEQIDPPPPHKYTPLPNVTPVKREKAPPIVRLPNGEEKPLKSWKSLLIEVAEWLIREGALTERDCPISRSKNPNSYLVHLEPKDRSGKGFLGPEKLSNGLHLYSHGNPKTILDFSKRLLNHLGKDPSLVLLKTG